MFQHHILLAAIISAAVSTDTNYRLNTPIKPESYDITITPYFDTDDSKAFTFDGEVIIKFRTQAATNQIKLHSEELIFTAANITVASGTQNIEINAANPLEFVTNYTFALINWNSNLDIGTEYALKISYRGPIRKDLSGFYRNYYLENGVKKWLGATQMEPTHARKVFPCFDEPDLKATFTLNIDRPESYKPSLTNMKLQTSIPLSNGYVREIFYPTPIMSTYLVAFLISEFEAGNYAINGTREFGVFTRPEATNQSLYAFDIGQRVEQALSAYFNIDYYSNNEYLKLDHVALPDFRAGAMENWGLIDYRESLLLYVPEVSTPYYKYRVVQIIAHETTHMWFGNLVTCHWWSNTWLNEGFANYFQDFITSLIEPEVGSGALLVTDSVYTAYDADDSSEAAPITNNDVNSPSEISKHFGAISYQKAGSIIRMMHHLLGDEAFILGLNVYLNNNKFTSGYPEKLYAAFDQGVNSTNSLAAYDGAKIEEVMDSWISQAGHPVLNVNIDYNTETVTLTQKRFYVNSSERSNEIYKIPITYTTGASLNFENTKPAFIMDNATYSFKIANLSHSWVIFNIQETGLYRVNYDDNSWEHIFSALKSEKREQIHHLNRAKIINDLFAFYYSDLVSFARLRQGLEFLKDETDYSVWYAALRGMNKLRNSYLGTEVLSEIDAFIIQVTDNLISKLGYEAKDTEGTVALRNRMQVLDVACKSGHTGCVENAVKLYNNLKDNEAEISPSLRPVSYCYGLRDGDEEDFEFLWRRMATTNIANEAAIIGNNLGCTKKDIKLKKYLLAMQEEESPIKIQDLNVPLASVIAHYENMDLVLEELKNNYQLWTTIYPSMETILSAIASALHKEEEFEDLVNRATQLLVVCQCAVGVQFQQLRADCKLAAWTTSNVVGPAAFELQKLHLNFKFETWLASCTQCSQQLLEAVKKSLTKARASASWAQAHKEEILTNLRNVGFVMSPSLTVLVIGLVTSVFTKY